MQDAIKYEIKCMHHNLTTNKQQSTEYSWRLRDSKLGVDSNDEEIFQQAIETIVYNKGN